MPPSAIDPGRAGGGVTRPVLGRGDQFVGAIVAGLAFALCVLAAAVTASGTNAEYAWPAALGRGLAVGAPLAVGLYACRLPPTPPRSTE